MSQKDSWTHHLGQGVKMANEADKQSVSSLASSDLGNVSVPSVKQYLQLAEEQQLEVDGILARLNISPELLNDNGGFITGLAFQSLIAELIELSQDELFGLHTAKFVQPFSYSVLGYITMNCETLGQAIDKIRPYEKLVGDMGTTTLEQVGEDFRISWHCSYPDAQVKRHMTDNCLASWYTFARYLTSRELSPKKILLRRKQPDREQDLEYQQLFACPVRYQQGEDTIIFDANFLQLPLDKGDKQLLPMLESHAESVVSLLSAKSDIVTQVMFHIESNLSNGKFHQQDIAELMGIGAKTLQRRLKQENTTFQAVLDKTRLSLAEQKLTQTNTDIDNLSTELGFTETRSFFRWFKKVAKQTPGDYRKSHTQS